ncbi:hypothetical protein K466DRAFT_607913 [Polyporus arcularius HHB13444]|uniref:Uncharacterized protein n=1 Tax=Polyporus arcularius HHB13444 TaxID=1314778 RepID=A0A5C3NLV4_9APHY|nr:hypothetical protein K466DRAFT_607913 [Polyporus arcularius HHB13444]
MRSRSKAQTGSGYKNNILVRLIVSTFTDLGLGTQNTDVKSREFHAGDGWLSVGTEDVVLALGMGGKTFKTTRSHVELAYKVYQWMQDNRRQWDGSDQDSEDQRLFDKLEAYCRRGILPPITSVQAATLTRAERDALLCGARETYREASAFVDAKEAAGVRVRLQAIPAIYEPEE